MEPLDKKIITNYTPVESSTESQGQIVVLADPQAAENDEMSIHDWVLLGYGKNVEFANPNPGYLSSIVRTTCIGAEQLQGVSQLAIDFILPAKDIVCNSAISVMNFTDRVIKLSIPPNTFAGLSATVLAWQIKGLAIRKMPEFLYLTLENGTLLFLGRGVASSIISKFVANALLEKAVLYTSWSLGGAGGFAFTISLNLLLQYWFSNKTLPEKEDKKDPMPITQEQVDKIKEDFGLKDPVPFKNKEEALAFLTYFCLSNKEKFEDQEIVEAYEKAQENYRENTQISQDLKEQFEKWLSVHGDRLKAVLKATTFTLRYKSAYIALEVYRSLKNEYNSNQETLNEAVKKASGEEQPVDSDMLKDLETWLTGHLDPMKRAFEANDIKDFGEMVRYLRGLVD